MKNIKQNRDPNGKCQAFFDGFPDLRIFDKNKQKPGEAALVYNAAPGVFFTGADMVLIIVIIVVININIISVISGNSVISGIIVISVIITTSIIMIAIVFT